MNSHCLAPLCPACGGKPVLLGALGRIVHWRCPACGYVYSRPVPRAQTLDNYLGYEAVECLELEE